MFCINCGAKAPGQFCSICGTRSKSGETAYQEAASNAVQSGNQETSETKNADDSRAELPSERGFDLPAPGERFAQQWNWGAALLCPFWLMNHRRPLTGTAVLVVGLIPFVNLLNIAAFLFFGVTGNRIATRSGRFTDEANFVDVQNAWRNWGIGLTIVYASIYIIYLFLRIALLQSGTPSY